MDQEWEYGEEFRTRCQRENLERGGASPKIYYCKKKGVILNKNRVWAKFSPLKILNTNL